MATRASKNKGTMEKFMFGEEGSQAETSGGSRIEGDKVREEMISGKEKTWEDTMEEMMQKYEEEIAKLRVEILYKEELEGHGRKKEEWEKERKQLEE